MTSSHWLLTLFCLLHSGFPLSNPSPLCFPFSVVITLAFPILALLPTNDFATLAFHFLAFRFSSALFLALLHSNTSPLWFPLSCSITDSCLYHSSSSQLWSIPFWPTPLTPFTLWLFSTLIIHCSGFLFLSLALLASPLLFLFLTLRLSGP